MNYYENPKKNDFISLTSRPTIQAKDLQQIITNIYSEIELRGDLAIKDFTKKYDGFSLESFIVGKSIIDEAYAQIDITLKNAILKAYNNIEVFHKAQAAENLKVEIEDGIELSQKSVGIERVGIYIPGGTAPLLSTILMLAIPARIAGCKQIVLCSPPTFDGGIHPSILATAKICGIKEIYSIGGAQAIAALSVGTETIPKVMKVFGPGNQYVTAAKEYALNYGVAMDLPAGPSELLVFADKTAIPAFVAADLLSQAEHGIDSQVILVCVEKAIAKQVEKELQNQVQDLPRKEIAKACLINSRSILFKTIDDAFEFINEYAPEHLIIASENAEEYVDKIVNAGSVFLGNYCPESAGDYASGTNHTLPTSGWAKSFSGVNLDAFTKKITFQSISKKGLKSLAKTITSIAREEQLEAHARAIDIRFKTE